MENKTMTSAEIEAAVDKLLVDAMVDYSAVQIGTRKTDNWEHDLWQVSFYRRGFGQSADFEFKTGIGLRHKKIGVAIKPKAAAVLSCLVRDAAARNQSFQDWCDDYGYNSDSIKCLNMYQECCETDKKLRLVFNRAKFDKIEELTRDY